MLGRIDNNCEIDTIAGPVPGLVQKPEYCLDHNYEVVLTNGGCGTGFVGVSGECQIKFNPHCCVGLDENLCPIYKGVLTVDKVVAGDYEGVDANKINACPTTDNIDINIALVGPEDLDNMNSILYGCGHAISYNPGTGVMKVTEIDAETCDLSLGGGTAIVCSDCRLHTCLAGIISCDTVYEPLACCTGVSSGETLNATAVNCDGKLIKMSCVGYEESPSGYDLPLCSRVIPGTSLTTNTAINTPFIYNDKLSVSAKCNITLGICPTCDSQNNWVTGSYVSLTKSGYMHEANLYSDHITCLKSGCLLCIQAGTDNAGYSPICCSGSSKISMASHDICSCSCINVSCAYIHNTFACTIHNGSNNFSVCACCSACVCTDSACIGTCSLCVSTSGQASIAVCGPFSIWNESCIVNSTPKFLVRGGNFAIVDSEYSCIATITSTGFGTFKGLCVSDGYVNINGSLMIYCDNQLSVLVDRSGTISTCSVMLFGGNPTNDWSDSTFGKLVPNSSQIDKHVKTNGINDVVVICSNCTYDSPLVDGHVYYLCFDSPMISADGCSPMIITYNWGTNCSKTYNLQYVNENGMGATYTGFVKCTGTTYYVDALAGFFVTPICNSLHVTGQAIAGRDSTGTCEYWIGRGWQSSVSAAQQSFNNARPIGSTYTQFPGTDDPNTLFNNGDITSSWFPIDYDGAFFRACGGNALGFNCGLQSESIGQHCHWTCMNMAHDHGVGSYCVWGEDSLGWCCGDGVNVYLLNNINRRSGGFQQRLEAPVTWTYNPSGSVSISETTGFGICLAAYKDHGFCGRSGSGLGNVCFYTGTICPQQPSTENRPSNYTIVVWKRIA